MLVSLTMSLMMGLQAPQEIVLPSQPAPLHGTMLSAPDARAAALILPGSGPTDRDGNSPLGIQAGTYRLLAEGLAAQGVTTLRIDKRGIAASAAAATKEEDLRFEHNYADARAWTAELAKRTGRPCIWLIGHSEGALVALGAAQKNDQVCGLVLISGAGRPAGVVLREQLAALPEQLRAQAMTSLADLEAGRTTNGPPELAALFRPSVQPYLISWLAIDPAKLMSSYDRPILIIHGTTDIQVTAADANALQDAQPRAQRLDFEGVNHVLKVAPVDRAANAATYADRTLPLAPGVVDGIVSFMRKARP